jgi:hypothetical protein
VNSEVRRARDNTSERDLEGETACLRQSRNEVIFGARANNTARGSLPRMDLHEQQSVITDLPAVAPRITKRGTQASGARTLIVE